MNDRPQSPVGVQPPAEAAEKLEAAKLKRVDDLSALAGTAWLALLGALAFVAITLLSTEHANVLVDNRMIELPIVGVPVPTRQFLALGPIALTVLFFNLHLYLLKLWKAFKHAPADKPAEIGEPGWRLADRIQPSLVNDYALTLKHGASPRDHRHTFLRNAICWLTVWAATPVVLGWMWCKSLLVREPSITGPILVCLALVLAIGAYSWVEARRLLGDPARRPVPRLANAATGTVVGLMLLAGYATRAAFMPIPGPAAATGAPTGQVAQANVGGIGVSGRDAYFRRPLDIDGEDVTGVMGSLEPFASQREDYRQAWCAVEGLPLELCARAPADSDLVANGLTVERQRYCQMEKREKKELDGFHSYRKCSIWFEELDRRFEADWEGERRQALAKVARTELKGMRLSGMSAEGANLTRANFEGSDLSWAKMPRVTLEEATLKGANLEGATIYEGNLRLANLTGADARGINLHLAQLTGASLRGTDLSGANLRSADLTGANLSGVDLTGADLQGARLTRANLDGAILTDARLDRVIGLEEGQLATAVGSRATLFGVSNRINAEGTLPGEFRVADCWRELPETVRDLTEEFEKAAVEFPQLGRRIAAYQPHVCPSRGPDLVGTSVGRRLYLPESNFDRRVSEADPWPPGTARESPTIALPWLALRPEPGG